MTQTVKETKKKKLKAISLPIRSDLSTVSNYPYEFAEKDHKDHADKTRQVRDTINLVKPQLLDPTNWIIEP